MAEQASFGRWLQRRRRVLGLTQAELGLRIGYAKETLRKVEAGTRRPSRQMIELLVEPLGIGADERATFLAFARPDEPLPELPSPRADGAPRWPSAVVPSPLTELVGREQELASLRRLLLRGGVRLVTLTGPPGVGKTRLAIALAAEMSQHFADGVAFVSLAPIAERRVILSTIARALELPEALGRPITEALRTFLRPMRLLLVLDNIEQAVAVAPEIADLLVGAPGLVMLVTSRERLRLRGERIVVVQPLSLPAAASSFGDGETFVASLCQSGAVRLFLARTQDVQPSFTITDANAGSISAICRRLDGLPLALELAAAYGRVLSPQALLAHLERGLEALAPGLRDLPERQQSLRATIAWSYDRLGPAEQRLFRRLAVFPGGATAEAAGWVGAEDWTPGPAPDDGGSSIDPLAALADRSLLSVEEQPALDGKPESRFRMLETIRAYASERLAQAGEEAQAQRRQCAWSVALAEQAEPELRGAVQVAWMDRLEREQDNLRAALGWSVEHDRRAALRLGKGLWRFWRQRGYLGEGRRWLEAILRRTGDDNSEEREARGWVLVGAGIIATLQGDLEPARSFLDDSVGTFRACGDAAGLAQALRDQGYVALVSGDDPANARAMFEEALCLARSREDARDTGAALYLLALLAGHEGEDGRARELAEASLALFRQLGDAWSLASSLWQLGRLALATGDLPQAAAYLHELLHLAQRHGDRQQLGLAFLGLAVVAERHGDLARARQLLHEGLTLYQASHDPTIYAALGVLGGLAIRQGSYVEGVRLLTAGRNDRQWQRRTQTRIDPLSFLHADEEESLARARKALGDSAFRRALAEGQAVTLEQAVASALTSARPPAAQSAGYLYRAGASRRPRW